MGDEEEEEDDRGAMVGDDGASEERLRESQGGDIERAKEKEEDKETRVLRIKSFQSFLKD